LHKQAVRRLRQRLPKVVVEPMRAAEARKAAVAGVEAAVRSIPLQPVRRT
jgi:hypothetical protein